MLLRKDTINDFNNSFKVFARVRPLNDQQLKYSGQKQLYTFDDNQIVIKTRIPEQSFKFDRIYGPPTSQLEIFDAVADQVIDKAFQGINGTIFCYGQTSSGKTHTIIGDYESKKLNDEGLLPRILREVIQKKNTLIDNVKQSNLDIRIKMSMIEIYNQKVIDLFDLSKKNLRLRENKKQGVFIEQVTQKYIVSTEQAMKFVYLGLQNRTAGRTNENTFSSRSHMVFMITIVETDFDRKEAKSARITLTDLAGSQRLSKTGVQGKMLLQTKKINLSLSTLGKVINAIAQGKKTHIPYRDSKLTRLLKESIGGNCLTRLIINISPSELNEYETISSLRFGSRARLIKNKPKVNKQYTVEQLLCLLQKAELKIKQLTKIIEDMKNGQLSQRSLPPQIIDESKRISLQLIDYNDQYQDDSSLHQQSSKQSLNFQPFNYLQNAGSRFSLKQKSQSQFESPPTKLKIRKSAISSTKSMKLLPIRHEELSAQIMPEKLSNQKAPIHQIFIESLELDEKEHFSQNQLQNDVIKEENEEFKNDSLKNSREINFRSFREMVDRAANDIKEKILINTDEIAQQGKTNSSEQQRKPKILTIIPSFEFLYHPLRIQLANLSGQVVSDCKDQNSENHNIFHVQKIDQITSELNKKLSDLSSTQNVNIQSCLDTPENSQIDLLKELQQIKQKYQSSLSEVQKCKALIQEQSDYIFEMKQKYKAKKARLTQNISEMQHFLQVAN